MPYTAKTKADTTTIDRWVVPVLSLILLALVVGGAVYGVVLFKREVAELTTTLTDSVGQYLGV